MYTKEMKVRLPIPAYERLVKLEKEGKVKSQNAFMVEAAERHLPNVERRKSSDK